LELHTPSVVVLKDKRVLHLFDGGTLIRTYPIDLGTDPLGSKTIDGDGRTPIGTFRIVSKNPHSPHHQFLGLSYPNRDAVMWGCARGLLSYGEAQTLLSDLDGDRCPDWTTPLGGGIGIHGGRRGTDWTGGCVALANQHIEELSRVLRVGDSVEILP
jgi:murein L,D-transpeptidase YafK